MHPATHAKPPTAKPVGNFRQIRLELARERQHPEGDARTSYLITAPLTSDDRIDPTGWKLSKSICRVIRFRPDQEPINGHLVHRPGGSWALRYAGGEDEAGYYFGDERFVVGEYVSIREGDEMHTYRVASVGYARL